MDTILTGDHTRARSKKRTPGARRHHCGRSKVLNVTKRRIIEGIGRYIQVQVEEWIEKQVEIGRLRWPPHVQLLITAINGGNDIGDDHCSFTRLTPPHGPHYTEPLPQRSSPLKLLPTILLCTLLPALAYSDVVREHNFVHRYFSVSRQVEELQACCLTQTLRVSSVSLICPDHHHPLT